MAQGISPLLEPLLPFDPLLPDPYTFHWSRPTAFNFGIPLIAELLETLLRLYVGDASLAPGSTVSRALKYSVIDPSNGVDYGAAQSQTIQVTAPGVAPSRGTQAPRSTSGCLLTPCGRARRARSRSRSTPARPRASAQAATRTATAQTVTDIDPADGGRVVVAPVPIFLITPDTQTVLKPKESDLRTALENALAMLPVPDDGITIAPSPGGLLIDQRKLEADGGCDHMLARLLEWRATPGEGGPGGPGTRLRRDPLGRVRPGACAAAGRCRVPGQGLTCPARTSCS